VVHAACQLAVHRFWGAGYGIRDITTAVSFMREATLTKGKTPPDGQLEMDASRGRRSACPGIQVGNRTDLGRV
jgi:hypothetical protein